MNWLNWREGERVRIHELVELEGGREGEDTIIYRGGRSAHKQVD